MSILGNLGDALKTLGEAAIAVPGAAYDIATFAAPGDQWGKADDHGFGGLLNSLGHQANNLTFFVPPSVKHGAGNVMHAAGWAYSEGPDRWISTLETMGTIADVHGAGSFFDGDSWAQAYGIADKQTLGQSLMLMGATKDQYDPMDWRKSMGGSPYELAQRNHAFAHPTGAALASLGADVAAGWVADPLVVAGKGAGALRQQTTLGAIKDADRARMGELLDSSQATRPNLGFLRPGDYYASRVDRTIDFVAGQNKFKRPLEAHEIRAAFPELTTTAEGMGIASALADAGKLTDATDRVNAARRIIAVASGDTTQIARLKAEVAGTEALADKLDNISRGSTVDLQRQAMNNLATEEPVFRQTLQTQLDNLDSDESVSNLLRTFRAQVDARLSAQKTVLQAADTLHHIPAPHAAPLVGSAAKVAKANGGGVVNGIEKAHDAVADTAVRLAKAPLRDSYSNVFQKGLYHVPLMLVYPAKWLAATMPTKALPVFVHALSTQHYTGVASIHDWDQTSRQLDSLMMHAGLSDADRIGQQTKIYGVRASGEGDKLKVIQETEKLAERRAVQAAASKHGLTISDELLDAIYQNNAAKRGAVIAARDGGRIYAATAAPEDILLRQQGMAAAKGTTDIIGKTRARADQILDENGLPISLALDTSQLANRVPLIDIHMVKQMVNDYGHMKRLEDLSKSWKDLSYQASGISAALNRARGAGADYLAGHLTDVRKMQDMVLHAASLMNRWWKMSVLFRLGYPMRVVADDHMRIAARLGYGSFLMQNAPEAARDVWWNQMGRVGFKGTRHGQARAEYALAKQQLHNNLLLLGRKREHTDEEWSELTGHVKTLHTKAATDEERAAARSRLSVLDPEGNVEKWLGLKAEAARLQRKVNGHASAVSRWQEQINAADGDIEKLKTKMSAGARAGATAQAELNETQKMLEGVPDLHQIRKDAARVRTVLDNGVKGFRSPKAHLGTAPIQLHNGQDAEAAFAPTSAGEAYRSAAGSKDSFDYQLTDGEQATFRMLSTGHWETVGPEQAGYYQLWANILNYQLGHGHAFSKVRELLTSGHDDVPGAFAKWLREPEQRDLRSRVSHYAHDPIDWGHRLDAVMRDYTRFDHTPKLLERLNEGNNVSARELEKMFPRGTDRPILHGSLAELQSGQNTVSRLFSDTINRMFTTIAEKPTDALSRHPFFNAVYKTEVRRLAKAHAAEVGEDGRFTQETLDRFASAARKKALTELKRTLWDVSAHSHAGHMLRFVSPFFTAHQEALNRWWNLAKDDPSVVRHFQMFFDNIRKTGLEYNPDTGEVVEPGTMPSPHNHILVKMPFAGDNNPVNKLIKKLGGGHYWNVNESGFNLILQNGLANPGVGPLVSLPTEELVHRYADAEEFVKVARVLNPYPPAGNSDLEIAENTLMPATVKRLVSLAKGEKSAEFARYYAQNLSDEVVEFQTKFRRHPDYAEMQSIEQKAQHQTHIDFLLMTASNVMGFTPGKPNSKFTAVQNGLQKLYSQMNGEGHDYQWLRDTFKAQYGDVYMPMIFSLSDNPQRLSGTSGEVAGLRRHEKLIRNLGTSDDLAGGLVRAVLGPDTEDGKFSTSAAAWEKAHGYRGTRDPNKVAQNELASEGWDQLDQVTNWLQTQADKQGLTSYEQSKELVAVKRKAIAQISEQNPWFGYSYNTWSRTDYQKTLDQLAIVANDRTLLKDPTRTDVGVLRTYLATRQEVSDVLKARQAAGLPASISAKANADVATAFANAVAYLNQSNTYFQNYMYTGLIEHDPYLSGSDLTSDAS